MNEQKQILEQYLQLKLSDKKALSISCLKKLADGWESDNYILSVEFGDSQRTCEDWVWRIYSGAGSQEKAAREFTSMKKLLAAGYPVPRVHLIETENSPVERPFIIMEYIPGEMMWKMIDVAPAERQAQLIDHFCLLFVQLHALDWKHFDANLSDDDPYFFIDQWLNQARNLLDSFPDFEGASFLNWATERRTLFACEHPSPVHQDFHPGNILISAEGLATIIDWTNFAVTDSRFDLAWTLVLAHAHGFPGMRDQILQRYQEHSGKPVKHIEVFEAIACARRLLDLTVSLTEGSLRMGMNAQAAQAIRSSMEAHRKVYRLFIEHTGLHISPFQTLFG